MFWYFFRKMVNHVVLFVRSFYCVCVYKEECDPEKLEEQAAILKKELILKERETLDVLKEVDSTKRLVEDLKSKLKEEESKAKSVYSPEENENQTTRLNVVQPLRGDFIFYPSYNAGKVIMELKQAKMNLIKISYDFAGRRAFVRSLNKKLKNDRIALEKTRERLALNCWKISSLEEELNQIRLRLHVAKGSEIKYALDDPLDVKREIQRMISKSEHFRKVGEAAKSEHFRTMSEIEETKMSIRTSELWLDAARKMKEASNAAEAVALSEIDALSNQNHEVITLSIEEYTALTRKARDAEEQSKKRVIDAMLEIDQAMLSKIQISKRVEEATKDVKTNKKALEEALERVEAANREKVAVEEALRRRKFDGHKRRLSRHNPAKFKNSSSGRRDSQLLDVNGMNLVNEETKVISKSSQSIRQILSRELLATQETEVGMPKERNSVQLGQIICTQDNDPSFDIKLDEENYKQKFSSKRKNFGLVKAALFLVKKLKKKNQPILRRQPTLKSWLQ
ncbi:putative WEB family protein [Lupinus albus]|uniref:Putative WEB family protein n=1 Tax=Lupinus albus TaxID=3870 RepID=A0A6A4R5V6_LUPAL|nr:putative WEB family protein [Lupinus albus]